MNTNIETIQIKGQTIKPKPNRAKALSTSEQRYRTLVETMGDGLSEIDENQITTDANEMLCQMWGRFKDEGNAAQR